MDNENFGNSERNDMPSGESEKIMGFPSENFAEAQANHFDPASNGNVNSESASAEPERKPEYRFDPQTGRPLYGNPGGCTYSFGPGQTEPIVVGRPASYYQQQQRENGYNPYGGYYGRPASEPAPKPAKKKKPASKGFVIGMMAITIAVSLALGYLLCSLTTVNGKQTKGEGKAVNINYVDPEAPSTQNDTDATYVNNKVGQAVVAISTETVATSAFYGQYVTEGAGSGVIISSDGDGSYILTCAHVVSGASTIKVTLNNTEQDEFDAELVGSDSITDTAVIKIKASGLCCAPIADYSKVVVGQYVVAIGNPLGTLGGSVTDGIVSALGRKVTIDGQTFTLLQTNAGINPGNSGGGLFDETGALVGIVNSKSSGENIESIGFAIPISDAMRTATELIENGYVSGRVMLGVTLFNVTDTTDIYNYWKFKKYITTYGVYVSESITDSFKPGDRIVAIDGVEVSTAGEIKSLLLDYSVGDVITVSLYRLDETGTSRLMEVKFTLLESTEGR